jgi:hypothetical protein
VIDPGIAHRSARHRAQLQAATKGIAHKTGHRAHIAHKKNLQIVCYDWAELSLCVMCVMCVIFSGNSMEIKRGWNDAKSA